MKWSVSEAKARFSELVTEAVRTGPQTVTRHGEALVLVVSPKQVSPLPEPDAAWRLPRVHQPGLTLSDADIDALFLGAPSPPPDAPATPPEPPGLTVEAADADPAGRGRRAFAT